MIEGAPDSDTPAYGYTTTDTKRVFFSTERTIAPSSSRLAPSSRIEVPVHRSKDKRFEFGVGEIVSLASLLTNRGFHTDE